MDPTADRAHAMITAIIPTFRRPRMLLRAVTSVLTQEGALLRAYVCDNASGDDTQALIARLAASDPRLFCYCHATNVGPAANFDLGLRLVETPYFSILSDDDYLLPGFYQRALDDLQANSDAMFWVGMSLNVDEEGTIWDARVSRWSREGLYVPPEGFMAMTGGKFTVWTGMVFRREVLDLEGLPDWHMKGPADREFCLRLAAKYPYVARKHPSAVYTLNSQSFSATEPLSSFWPGWKQMLQKFERDRTLTIHSRDAMLHALRRDAESMLFRHGAHAIAGQRLDFARAAAEALEHDCRLKRRAWFLRAIADACAHSAIVQRAYAYVYRMAERRIVRSRRVLQAKYGHLLKSI